MLFFGLELGYMPKPKNFQGQTYYFKKISKKPYDLSVFAYR